jgi:hypothetical protein
MYLEVGARDIESKREKDPARLQYMIESDLDGVLGGPLVVSLPLSVWLKAL